MQWVQLHVALNKREAHSIFKKNFNVKQWTFKNNTHEIYSKYCHRVKKKVWNTYARSKNTTLKKMDLIF